MSRVEPTFSFNMENCPDSIESTLIFEKNGGCIIGHA
jgi:hypothetical protein